MKNDKASKKPWLSIIWFTVWGIFQLYAVASILCGRWARPEAFPEEAYNALIYPDMFFIPLYLGTSVLLFKNSILGKALGLICCGAVLYVMIYLLALSEFKGTVNLIFDSIFIIVNFLALAQITNLLIATEKSTQQ